jgi:hypothetical protein
MRVVIIRSRLAGAPPESDRRAADSGAPLGYPKCVLFASA